MKKKVADSRTELTRILRYQYLNGQRRLFGGALMQWIDELAGIVAGRHCESNVITAAVDTLVFKESAYLNDLIVLTGRITYIGKTSMEVKVNTYVEKRGGKKHKINEAYLVFVSIDEEGRPIPVPALELVSDEERHEWEAGEKRYALRKQRRDEGF